MKIQAKKHLGQNFLTNPSISKKIVSKLNVEDGDSVIEIGGGKGSLTQELVKSTKNLKSLTVYELDGELVSILEYILKSIVNANVIHANILDAKLSLNQNSRIIGSIPYNITSPIIHKLLSENPRPKQIVLLIQKEVADKLTVSKPNYWQHITLGYTVKKMFNIKSTAFSPQPTVTSTLISMDIDLSSSKTLLEIGFHNWSEFLHTGFAKPRKMLNKAFEAETLKEAEIDYKKRPHELLLSDWLRLYDIL